MKDWFPCIVRVAGLPASAIEPFHSRLGARLRALLDLEADLDRERARAVDVLHGAVPRAAPGVRRLLLQWRRACFNRRAVGSSWTAPQDAELPSAVRTAMERVALLESEVAEKNRDFLREFEEQRRLERSELVRRAADPVLARGIALASPSTAANLKRLQMCPQERFGRKELKLEQSLLRFISRAALKLSPFSTLTSVGLASLEERDPSESNQPVWEPGPFRQRSLLRLKRYLFHQMIEVLFAAPELRPSLSIALNNSIDETSPGRFRFFRRGYRGPDPETRGTRLNRPAILRMDLDSAAVEHMRSQIGNRRFGYAETVALLESFFGSADGAAAMVDELLSLGFLEPVAPWSNTDVRVETRLLDYLRSAPCRDELAPLIKTLSRIVELEDGFAQTGDPERSVEEIGSLLNRSWQQVISFADLDPDAQFVQSPKGELYEDIFLESSASPNCEIATLPRTPLQQAMTDVEPLLALGSFYDRRVDFLTTCSVLLRKRWPGRKRIGLMDVFAEAQPLYHDYLKSEAEIRRTRDWTFTFDPWELDSLKTVKQLRSSLAEGLQETLAPAETGLRIVPEALGRLVGKIPPGYTLRVGGCLFLQPALASGELWVLNRLYEGTGRYSSRYTAVMDESLRQRLALHFEKGSRLQVDGRGAEVLDLLCAQGDTLNVHARQTPRVLEFPGEDSGAPAERLTLRDLWVELPKDDAEPLRVVDSDGSWILPAHLGGTRLHAMPILVKFLSLFGPGEIHPVIPLPPYLRQGNMSVRDRVTLGRVVVLRRRWKFSTEGIPKQKSTSDADFFRAVNRWRLESQLPERLFFLEKRPALPGQEIYKPQYIDFTSPCFISIFRSLLTYTLDPVVAEEVLPQPEDLPRDAEGQQRCLEAQLEAVTFGPRESRSTSQSLVSTSTKVV